MGREMRMSTRRCFASQDISGSLGLAHLWLGASTHSHGPFSFSSDGLDGDLPQASPLSKTVLQRESCLVKFKPSKLSPFYGGYDGFFWANKCFSRCSP
ncbi:hypothetical protein DPMN_041720 [Dreissena polymorpha]|uniref:Uncharacterized protein n=1 Tax=Dreissena polymorpha TaxID=45954 RepID=A0A9D4CXC1_DREPO|nr:hypothetical protein DPMN_041720 [Dreissena polymorpha]